MGIPLEKITQIENGVKAQLGGDFRVVIFPMIELFLQNENIGAELKSYLESIKKSFNYSQIYGSFNGTMMMKSIKNGITSLQL